MLRRFGKDLSEFSSRLIPDMLALLRKNSIANPERLLLDLVDEQLATLESLTRAHKSKGEEGTTPKPSKVRKTRKSKRGLFERS